MKIPILNLFYMLSYSWNCLDEDGILKVSHSEYKSLKNLLTKVLSNGCNHLIKRGLDRSYILVSDEYNGVKGKININETVNKLLHIQCKTICEYDEFDYNIVNNQIIKATISLLLNDKGLELNLRKELKNSFQNFHKVDLVPLNHQLFSKIIIHKNNRHYELLLRICKFIYDNSTLNENASNLIFKDFARDDYRMARLFESFVFNFYRTEQTRFKVKGENIDWAFSTISTNSSSSFLPKMQTDITLINQTEKVIIDAKYYSKTLVNNFNKETFHSSNLYQLYSYLMNQEGDGSDAKLMQCTGILLYPLVEKSLNEVFMHKKHKIIIRTVNLANVWQEIKTELLEIIDFEIKHNT